MEKRREEQEAQRHSATRENATRERPGGGSRPSSSPPQQTQAGPLSSHSSQAQAERRARPSQHPPQQAAGSALGRHLPLVALVLAFFVLGAGVFWLWPEEKARPLDGPLNGPLDGSEASRQPETSRQTGMLGAGPEMNSYSEAGAGRGAGPYTGEATLSVRSRPAGALVSVDGDSLGKTPVRQHVVAAGAHFISVQKEGYAEVDSVFLLRNDRPVTFRVGLTRPAGEAPSRRRARGALRATASRAQRREDPRAEDPRAEDPRAEESRAAGSPAGAPSESATAVEEPAAERSTPEKPVSEASAKSTEGSGSARRYEEALQRGDGLFVDGRYEAALDAYTEARQVRPGDERAGARAAKARRRVREEEKQRAEQYQYYRARGDLLFEQKRYQEARANYERALKYRSGDAYVKGRLAEARASAAEKEAAAEEEAPETDPAERATAEQKEKAAREDGRKADNAIHKAPDEAPSLVGGSAALTERVKYPRQALKRGVEGRVFMRAVISKTGEVRSVEVLRGVSEACNEAAVRALKASTFRPATDGGRPVAAYLSTMVKFRIQK